MTSSSSSANPSNSQPLLRRGTITEPLLDPEQRRRMFSAADETTPIPVMIELNLRNAQGLPGADQAFLDLYHRLFPSAPDPILIGNTYYRCDLAMADVRRLVDEDQKATTMAQRAIYRVWPDFPVRRLMDRPLATVKADAAQRAYNALGMNITWGVIDSGIEATHPHFSTYHTLSDDVANLHVDFLQPGPLQPLDRSADPCGHGTHVAGIIAGGLLTQAGQDAACTVRVGERIQASNDPDSEIEAVQERTLAAGESLTGVAPRCKLVSLRVLDESGSGVSSDVIRALQYVREQLNGNGKMLRVHGVNLSLGYSFNPRWFACGQSPICVEVDRLVRSGVVVVVAAGNYGYGQVATNEGQLSSGLAQTITDPGNAELAITVGSTHRDMPHTYGVSYFSSKGPTGDGRAKPDLVAPGEAITSCAVGQLLTTVWNVQPKEQTAFYLDDSGTSMAAPHVSGVIAAFLSIRREYIGRPEEVKRIFLQTATSLGRERYFEGNGLIDLMRAIQSV
jgi:serine protease AprX